MKKLLTLVMAFVCVFSMSTAAFAAVPTATEETEIELEKVYQLLNDDDATSPEETFNFVLTKESVTDSKYTLDTMPVPAVTAYAINYAADEATVSGDKNTAVITLPSYDCVGIYTYKITETAGTTAGVVYDAKPVYMKVMVIDNENGALEPKVTFHYDTVEGEKKGFTNTYEAGTLEVGKVVTGNYGDKTKDFEVKVTFKAPTGLTVKEAIVYASNVTGDADTGNVAAAAMSDGTEVVTINLKDGEKVTFKNIPYGVTYTVEETSYSEEGYDAATYAVNGGEATTKAPVDEELDDAAETVSITNNKDKEVKTGINLDSLPYIMIMAVVAVSVAAFVMKKRYDSID